MQAGRMGLLKRLLTLASQGLDAATVPFRPASRGAEELRSYYSDPNTPRSLNRLGITYALEFYSQNPRTGIRNPKTLKLNVGGGNLIGTTLGQETPLIGAFNQGSVSEGNDNQIYIDLGDIAGLVQAATGSVRHNAGSDGQYGLAGGVGILNSGRIDMGSGTEDRIVAFAGKTGLFNSGLIQASGRSGDRLVVWGAGGQIGIDQRGKLISRRNSDDEVIASALQANAEATERQLTGLSVIPGYKSFIEALRDGLSNATTNGEQAIALNNHRKARISLKAGDDQLLAAAPEGALALRNQGWIGLGSGDDLCTIEGSFDGDGLINFGAGEKDQLNLLPGARYKISKASEALRKIYNTDELLYLEGLDSRAAGSLYLTGLELIGNRSVEELLSANAGEFQFDASNN